MVLSNPVWVPPSCIMDHMVHLWHLIFMQFQNSHQVPLKNMVGTNQHKFVTFYLLIDLELNKKIVMQMPFFCFY